METNSNSYLDIFVTLNKNGENYSLQQYISLFKDTCLLCLQYSKYVFFILIHIKHLCMYIFLKPDLILECNSIPWALHITG